MSMDKPRFARQSVPAKVNHTDGDDLSTRPAIAAAENDTLTKSSAPCSPNWRWNWARMHLWPRTETGLSRPRWLFEARSY